MQRRNTLQKELVYDAVRSLACHASADEVYFFVAAKYPNIGKGTVYRNLAILSSEGKVKKIEIPNGADRFDHNTSNHYHVRCIKCGRVGDAFLEYDVLSNTKNTSGMDILDFDILYKGICMDCKDQA